MQVRRSNRSTSIDPDLLITIKYGIRPNRNTLAGGFLPYITESNGEGFSTTRGDKWSRCGWNESEALKMAEEWAREEGARYLGDYIVTIEKDCNDQKL